MVFQRPNPFPKSIFENVAYGLRMHYGLSKSELADGVDAEVEAAAEAASREANLVEEGRHEAGGKFVFQGLGRGPMSLPVVIGSGNPDMPRSVGLAAIAGVKLPSIYQCAAGSALVTIAFGHAFGPMT